MSPYNAVSDGWANVFYVHSNGRINNNNNNVNNTNGVRSVINLKSDTTFADGGTGTAENPYVVV